MLAHADKRAVVTSIQDLVINRAQPNTHLLRRRRNQQVGETSGRNPHFGVCPLSSTITTQPKQEHST
jgi:hypothetical protein